MALISMENITFPIRNKWHLVTICVVAALFGVWRASGGGFEVSVPEGSTNVVQPVPARNSVSRDTISSRNQGSRNIDNIINSRPPTAAKPKAPQQEQRGSRSSLDDIEKSLGLR